MPSTPKPAPKKTAAPAKAAKPKTAPAPVSKQAPAKKPAPAPSKKPAAPPAGKPAPAPAAAKPAVKTVPAPAPAEAAKAPPQPPKPPAAPNTPGNGFLVIRPFSRTAEAKKAAEEKQPSKQAKLSATELRRTRDELVAMRNRLTAKAHVMRRVALERNDEINTEEDGIDQFDRLFEIEKIASVQEFVYLIDEALHALDEGVYGVCQKCGGAIEKARIQALPFAKACIHCQNEAERMKARA